MGRKAFLFILSSGLCALMLAFPEDAHAYLNPGAGSFLFQLAIAALLGGLLTLKIYWRRVLEFFRRLFSPGTKNG